MMYFNFAADITVQWFSTVNWPKVTMLLNTSDVTDPGHSSCPIAVSIFFSTTMALITLAAFIGNILVIFSVYKTPCLRTTANYYYVNMAVSDFFSSLATWPLYLVNEIVTTKGSLFQGPWADVGCKLGVFVRLSSSSVSILSMVLIAVDRFIAIVLPLKSVLLTGKLRAGLLLITWVISTSTISPTLYYNKVETVGEETYCRFAWNPFSIMIFYITTMTMINVIPLITITILYSRILRVLQSPKEGHQTESTLSAVKKRQQHKNIMKIFRSIVIAYFICFFLFCVYLILKITFAQLFVKDKCRWILGFAYFVLPSLSTAVNPVILFLYSRNYRQALKNLIYPLPLFQYWHCYKGRNANITKEKENIPLARLAKYRQNAPC